MKITLEWIENQETRNYMAAAVVFTLPSEDFAELLALAKRGLGPRLVVGEGPTTVLRVPESKEK